MARGVRINNAKNFAGKPYLVDTDLQSAYLSGASLNGNTLELTHSGGYVVSADLANLVQKGNDGIAVSNNSVSLQLNTADTETSKYAVISGGGLTLKGIDAAIGQAIADVTASGTVVSAGSGIDVARNGNVATVALNAADTATVSVTYGADGKAQFNNRVTLAKLDNTTAGYAASYQLQDADGTAIGSTINILKDQFLKEAGLAWSTDAATMTNESAEKTATAIYPFLKFQVFTNDNGDSADDTVVSTVYVPVNDLFHDAIAGDGISIEHTSAGNVISLASSANISAGNGINIEQTSGGKIISLAGSATFSGTDGHDNPTTNTLLADYGSASIVIHAPDEGDQQVSAYITPEGIGWRRVFGNAGSKTQSFRIGGLDGNDAVLEIIEPAEDKSTVLRAGIDGVTINDVPVAITSSASITVTPVLQTVSSVDAASGSYLVSSACSIIAGGHITEVRDAAGEVIYPTIVYSGGTPYLIADYGQPATAPAAETWTVLYVAGAVVTE